MELDEDLIESRIAIHDSNHFEAKLDYTVDPTQRRNRYHVECYFFVPARFGLTSHTYTASEFYSDVQAFIRFKTPTFSLTALRDLKNKRAPLARAYAAAKKIKKNPQKGERQGVIGYELRMFGALLRANLRDRVQAVEKQLANNGNALEDVEVQCRDLTDELPRVLSAFREFAGDIADPVFEPWVRESFQAVDEYVSLLTDEYLTRLLYRIDNAKAEVLDPTRANIAEIITGEQKHRKKRDYVLVSQQSPEENEYVTYRRTLLKDFVMSVLLLEFDKAAKEGRALRDLTGAVAAGVAMLFAVLAAILAQTIYGMNTWPFILAAVISYVFKDRIKEWLRNIMSTRFARFVPDYRMAITDPLYGVHIGRCRETFVYVDRDRVPKEILDVRHKEDLGQIVATTKREVVFKYVKDVVLDGRVIGQHHHRVSDINDIIRFNVSQFLARAQDPVSRVRLYDKHQDRAISLSLPRVYHLNVVFALHAKGRARPTIDRVRVVLDRNGIRRIEEP